MDGDGQIIQAIEVAALRALPPQHVRGCHGWLLRAGRPGLRRINTVQALSFDENADPLSAIGEAEAWYREREARPGFQLTDGARPAGLGGLLAARGYAREAPSTVMTAVARQVPGRDDVELSTRLTPAVMNAIADPYWNARQRAECAALFGRTRKPHVFAFAHEGGEPVAGGFCVVDGDLAGIFQLVTHAARRRQGFGRAVLDRLAGWGAAMGASRLYLQVEDDNAAALALYRSAGFERAYGYCYMMAPRAG